MAEAANLAQEYNDILQHDGLCLRITSRISGKPVYTLVDVNDSTSTPDVQDIYEIALSFAGEDRAYVEEVAAYLKKNDVRCFYDGYEEATLWGKGPVRRAFGECLSEGPVLRYVYFHPLRHQNVAKPRTEECDGAGGGRAGASTFSPHDLTIP